MGLNVDQPSIIIAEKISLTHMIQTFSNNIGAALNLDNGY